jgi:5'-nucleotidase
MPTLLIVNDDGVQSPMLPPMVEKLSALGRVRLAVPLEEQSWKSKAMTRFGRISVERRTEFGVEACAVGGTPSDCVNLAVHLLFADPPDWVVSGINIGTNTGLGFAINSGTVGAALEGALQGLPAVAFSTLVPPELFRQWGTEKRLTGALAQRLIDSTTTRMAAMMARLLETGLPPGAMMLNVNFPGVVGAETPVRWVPLQNNRYGPVFKPEGEDYVHGLALGFQVLDEGPSDREVVQQGEISVTALSLAGLSVPPPAVCPF